MINKHHDIIELQKIILILLIMQYLKILYRILRNVIIITYLTIYFCGLDWNARSNIITSTGKNPQIFFNKVKFIDS